MKRRYSTFRLSILWRIVVSIFFITSCNNSGGSFEKIKITDKSQNANGRNDAWGFTGAGGGNAMFNADLRINLLRK